MDDLERWLVLRSVRGLGERKLKKLLSLFGSSEGILNAQYSVLQDAVGERTARALKDLEGVNPHRVRDVLRTVEREGLGYLTMDGERYPGRLLDLPDPPPVLFYRGVLRDVPLAAVVGPRRPTPYTLSFTRDTVSALVGAGYGVVSGGAVGVDSTAHLTAVENSGYTVCVLGCGLLKARGRLFRRVESAGGLLLSEFLPEEEGSKHTFPKRNRVIASLCTFLVLPEAGVGSGALITARYAARLGRRVFIHIGIGRSPAWEGCYTLLREGVGELLRDVGEILNASTGHSGDPLLEFLRTPRSFEEIMAFTSASYEEVCALLTELELAGKVRRLGSLFSA